MPHYDTKPSSKGRLILPADLRHALQMEAGDTIEWIDKGEYPALETWKFRERIILQENARLGLPKSTGIFRDYAPDMPILEAHEMRELAAQYMAEELERELQEIEAELPDDENLEQCLLPPAETRITTKGQITMPEPYRRKFNIQSGDMVVLNDEINHLSVRKAEHVLARVAGSLSAYAGNGPTEIDREQIWADIAKERDERIQRQVAEDRDDLD